MQNIRQKIEEVKTKIEKAAARSGRDPSAIELVAVSKTKGPELIREAYDAGLKVFGENYAQEIKEKASALSDLEINWHFVGHLQKNKAKVVAPIASCIETVDSIELADMIDKRAVKPLNCMIEVNLGGEESKSGVLTDQILPIANHISTLRNLELVGLMIIPPYDPNPESGRPYFKKLGLLLDELNVSLKRDNPLTELSMGMSHDFEVAIEEGATIIRVGTAIFGERQ